MIVTASPEMTLPDTIMGLRGLHRQAEAKALRLRLLLEVGQELSRASASDLQSTLSKAAHRVALFSGFASGSIVDAPPTCGLAIASTGTDAKPLAYVAFEPTQNAALDDEDQQVLTMLLSWMATAMERVERENERYRLLRLLQDREKRLELVVSRLFSAQEEERRRVSHELHDGIAQLAAALLRQLEVCSYDLAQKDRHNLEPATRAARSLIGEIRAIIAGLRPTALDDLGLVSAISALATGLSDAGYHVELKAKAGGRWPELVETALYRVAQEALTNVRKHAGGPCSVVIRLEEQPSYWNLSIHDRGLGFAGCLASGAPVPDGNQIGLEVMRERMAAIGGTLEIRSSSAEGTEVVAQAPRVLG